MRTFFVVVALTILAGYGYAQDLPTPGICGVSLIEPKPATRIVNGQSAIPHSRPYQLLLVGYFPNGTAKAYCGASLIKPTHVLTAAHCVAGYDAKDLRIFPGLHNFTSFVFNRDNGIPAQRHIAHESYNANSLSNDVAIIRLQTAVVVDNHKIGLVCLPDSTSQTCGVNHPVVASGWGSTTGNPNRTSASRPVELQQVALKCVDAKSFGDSGGPLVREKYLNDGRRYVEQVGIMSGTIDCSFSKPHPDVYADVHYLMPWIRNKVQALP
ncbi:unnamed protein product [Rotaria sp. Silwood1]|nr:unnamed protein product [Rotaria sp. Silwood1]CAF1029027.1 unnamed protein product [Rotaria sp. Silwood1]CAF3423677.1 unnamed protein product [Rotaria sp. Silwood1]CAF3424050.1 unnamed protein product [Rotaria sp. Silwood1]CAF4583186.1 unnamed protein product [Rotaria sp. Silwood1]